MTDADLRRLLARPASLSDVLEAWMITHPRKDAGKHSGAARSALRRDMKKDGATDTGLDFWMGSNNG